MELIPFTSSHSNEFEEELLQYQENGIEVSARTAELYSEQGNTDLSEFMVIDEMISVQSL